MEHHETVNRSIILSLLAILSVCVGALIFGVGPDKTPAQPPCVDVCGVDGVLRAHPEPGCSRVYSCACK